MTQPNFVTREFPSRIANLGFSVELPDSWKAQDLPEEEPAFDDATQLFGLAAVAAPYAAVILAAAARPAFEEGTVQDWALWLIQQNQVQPSTLGPSTLGELPAIVGQCAVQGDIGPMTMFFAFAEDGGRLVHISVIGPDALVTHVFQVWQRVLSSFRLAAPQGPTVFLHPQPEVLLDGVQFHVEIEPSAPADGQPEWARKAYALEAQDRLEEAEQAMQQGCDQIGVLISIAEMYRQRMLRLAQAGGAAGEAGVAFARSKAVEWACRYAGSATSGGEGAALSIERDEFIRSLGGHV